MFQTLKDLLTSKKFQVTFFSVVGLICMAATQQITWVEMLEKAWPLIVAYLAAQGIADFGKSKVVTEQRAITARELQRKALEPCCSKPKEDSAPKSE